ncbi:abortive infection family protein [Nubsella zeaxanthinifaciens]|uniref:abortive infection family protein n=1 Tax=Nubsella zeaxanthinifaciens TaxID=392412 RepID=UPI003CFE9491
MAELSYQEKKIVKDSLIQQGYVLDFSNNSFNNFVADVTKINIDDPKYSEDNSGSKGQRLLKFIELESDYVVGILLKALYDELVQYNNNHGKPKDGGYYELYSKMYMRLISGGNVVEHIDAIQANNDDKDFNSLAKLIRESIEKNEPEAALDRLHTFLIKFLKELCNSYGVAFTKDETVNALYGKYIKIIREKKFIESEMSDKIIKFSFQVIDAFNDIRNNKSFAHDNPILNYDESVLIFSNVTAMVKFIQSMEAKHKSVVIAEAEPDWGTF